MAIFRIIANTEDNVHYYQFITDTAFLTDGENMTKNSGSQVYSGRQPTRERIGLVVDGTNAAAAIKTIIAAEAAGVRQIWMAQSPDRPDILTIFAATAIKTSTVRLGTAIVLTYPRHPLLLAQQALAIYDIAPGRLRLGIGPSHRLS